MHWYLAREHAICISKYRLNWKSHISTINKCGIIVILKMEWECLQY